jgi:hypothetical protein
MSIVLVPTKDRASEVIRRFKLRAESETGKKLRSLRTDRDREFNSENFDEYCLEQGVRRELTAPYSAQ